MSGTTPNPALTPRAVAARIWSVLSDDLSAYILLALVLVGAPTVLSDSALFDRVQWGLLLVGGMLQVLLTTTVTHSVLARLAGKPVPIRASIGAGLRFWPLAFGVQLVSGLAVLAGLCLLVVPGVMLALRWLLPVPALMAEELGLGPSLQRSTTLTDGVRWPLLSLLIAWGVPFLLIPTLLIRAMSEGGAAGWQVAAVDMVFDMAGALTSAAGIAIVYAELRGAVSPARGWLRSTP